MIFVQRICRNNWTLLENKKLNRMNSLSRNKKMLLKSIRNKTKTMWILISFTNSLKNKLRNKR